MPARADAAAPDDDGGPLARLLRPRFRGVPLLTLALLGIAFWLVVGNWLPTRAASASTQQALERQRRDNRAYAERIRNAEAGAERLEKDPWAHERILRDALKMSRPGEVIVR